MNRATGNVDQALGYASELFGGTLEGERKYGWGRKSAGSAIAISNDPLRWLRVQFSDPEWLNEKLWSGEILAPTLPGISKPTMVKYADWEADGLLWRALLMTYVEYPACSATPALPKKVAVDALWLQTLRKSLERLSQVETERVCCRQDLINRRIKERYGSSIDTEISEWVTSHGDVHWANLTHPKLVLLDWEVWGLAPRGFDPALLLGFSGLFPDLCQEIESTFSDWLGTRDGILSTLFVSSELLRMIELYGDHPFLKESLDKQAERALSLLALR